MLPELGERGGVQVVADADNWAEKRARAIAPAVVFVAGAGFTLLGLVLGELDEFVDEPTRLYARGGSRVSTWVVRTELG